MCKFNKFNSINVSVFYLSFYIYINYYILVIYIGIEI